jgi:hypothetical protein
MKTLKFSLVIIATLLFFTATFAQTLLKEQTIETNFGKNLKVNVPSGKINIKTWNKEEVYVKITGNDEAKDKYDFKINSNSGNVEVLAAQKYNDNGSNISLIVDVSIPDKFNTNVSTAGGDIKTENSLTGDIKFNTAGGDIVISSISGKCSLNTAGGDISVQNFSGDLKVNTAGGNIKLNGSDGKVKANSAGGNIELKYSGENKGTEINTLGGNIELTIPSGFQADCKLSSLSGDIISDIAIDGNKDKEKTEGIHSIKGKMNGGGNVLKCSTNGGNIKIHSF